VRPRFLAPDLDPSRGEAKLPDDEAQHLVRVLRMRRGDEVEVFDGRGCGFLARVASIEGRSVTVTLERRLDPEPEPLVPFAYAQSILKGPKMDDVVRDATMLGARAIIPLVSKHVAVAPGAIERGRPAERWRRVALAAAKQCRRTTLPEIADPQIFGTWLRTSPQDDLRLLFVEPAASSGGVITIRSLLARPRPASATLVAGPEGGWSEEELRSATEAGYQAVTLGPLTLRADAMAVAAIAVFRVLWDEERTPTSPLPPPIR
jgi:16S rRNA (uracil1498-N3)-methyltransferase